MLTAKDLAERWQFAEKTIYNKISNGSLGIPIIRIPDPRFHLADVLDFENKSKELKK